MRSLRTAPAYACVWLLFMWTGRMEAFTIGSMNERENMAVIHIEKANPDIKGLYTQFINQQFLVNEFPDAALVNREDDVGDGGP